MLDAMERMSERLARWLAVLAGVTLVSMMVLACANMVLRAVWVPVQGTFELMGYLGAVVAALSLAEAQRQKAHIAVGLLLKHFPRVVRRIADGLMSLVSCVFFLLVGIETGKWAVFLVRTGEVSETLQIIYYPFLFATAFGCLALTFVLFTDTLRIAAGREGV